MRSDVAVIARVAPGPDIDKLADVDLAVVEELVRDAWERSGSGAGGAT